jgi:hypothetical protein
VGVPADTLILPGVDHNQDVSMKSPFLVDSARICWAVSLSMTIVGPRQSGHVQVPRIGCGAVGGEGECGRGLVSRVCLHRVDNPVRWRLARKPKKRMRTKPRGSVCNRNRHRWTSIRCPLNSKCRFQSSTVGIKKHIRATRAQAKPSAVPVGENLPMKPEEIEIGRVSGWNLSRSMSGFRVNPTRIWLVESAA